MRNLQKFINVMAAAALLFSVTVLVVMSARQVGADPRETCLQYIGCSH
jgi:hypothetical protein